MIAKQETAVAKGVAICRMLVHHLYPWKDRLVHGNFNLPLLVVYDLESYLGHLAKICVAMFLFLSGYGLYQGYQQRCAPTSLGGYVLAKTANFYSVYWLNFIVFVSLGLLFFRDVTLFGSQVRRHALEPANC